MHARVAIDRPRLVREWLLQEGAERAAAGLAPVIPGPLAGGRPPTEAGHDLVLRVAAELASMALVREALSRTLTRQGWADELHPLVLLAVSEAVANAVEHGSAAGAMIEVGLTVTPEWAAVQVVDEGRLGASVPLGPPASPPASHPRGRGRLLMLGLAERVAVQSDGHGTSVLLQFARPAATEGEGALPTVPPPRKPMR